MHPPRIRPTDEEVEERVEFVMQLEARALLPGQLKREFREKYGDVPHRTIMEYVARARAIFQQTKLERREELANRAIARYEEIMRSFDSSPSDRIRAQERIDKIWGVEAPTRTEHSGIDGGPIQIEQLIAASELTPLDVQRALSECRITETTTN